MSDKRGFNSWMVSTFGVSTAAVIIILAERGPGIVETLKVLPALLTSWTQESPIGAWTLVAALVLPALLSVKLYSWLGVWKNRHTKALVIDLAGFGASVALAYALMPGLPGLLIGVFCASLVSTLAAWIRAACVWLDRKRPRIGDEGGGG